MSAYVRQGRGMVGRGGPVLGKIEEYFAETLRPATISVCRQGAAFRGHPRKRMRRLQWRRRQHHRAVPCRRQSFRCRPISPIRCVACWPTATAGRRCLEQVADWLRLQKEKSVLPKRGDLLVETFPRGNRHYMVAYPFEGRLAHQTLGMLLTRRLERANARPLGFVATDYSLAVWALDDMAALFKARKPSLAALFDEDMLGDDLEAWLNDSWMLKRTFRTCAVIAGLIEKRFPGQEKSGRQVTVSADLIYDVLRSYEPDHILLRATRTDASAGLLDVSRLAEMLSRVAVESCISILSRYRRWPCRSCWRSARNR